MLQINILPFLPQINVCRLYDILSFLIVFKNGKSIPVQSFIIIMKALLKYMIFNHLFQSSCFIQLIVFSNIYFQGASL
jgi:hypothetical protein